jgi:hypothetical protein
MKRDPSYSSLRTNKVHRASEERKMLKHRPGGAEGSSSKGVSGKNCRRLIVHQRLSISVASKPQYLGGKECAQEERNEN